MHTILSYMQRPIYIAAFSLATAVFLYGCSSKNPLIDDTAPSTQSKPDAVVPEKQKAAAPVLNRPPPTGLGRVASFFSPYKIDIQQGNFISHEMLAKIQPGMTKEQVRFALGTPLLTDIFHGNQWDYMFRLQKPDGTLTSSRVTIFFDGNQIKEIKNDQLPSESEYLSRISGEEPKPSAKEETAIEKKPPLGSNDTVPSNSPSKEESQ